MQDNLISALSAMGQVVNHWITNFLISAALIGTGGVIKAAESAQEYVSLAEVGALGLSVASWMQLIGATWILIQILNFCGFFRAAKWLFVKIFRGRKNEL